MKFKERFDEKQNNILEVCFKFSVFFFENFLQLSGCLNKEMRGLVIEKCCSKVKIS